MVRRFQRSAQRPADEREVLHHTRCGHASLGRNLASCGTRTPCSATATVPLIVPGTQFDVRFRRLDLRLTKSMKVGPKIQLQGNIDVYNTLNSSSVLQVRTAYGSQWLRPTEIIDARIVQFSGRLTF